MRPFRLIIFFMVTCGILAGSGYRVEAEERSDPNRVQRDGPYLVVEGYVKQMSARILIINDQQYPISMFARVFDANGNELSVQQLSNTGKIDQARIYILGGKIEKIVVLKNI